MKIAFCDIGYTSIASNFIAERFGFELVNLPLPDNNTILKGVSLSNEFACFPFKVITGIFFNALEKGAELLIMPAGESASSCQTADFTVAHNYLFKKQGYKFDIAMSGEFKTENIFNIFKKYNPGLTMNTVREAMIIFIQKLLLMDRMEKNTFQIWLTNNRKNAEIFKNKWENKIGQTDSITGLYRLKQDLKNNFLTYSTPEIGNILKIGVIGDIYTLNSPLLNNNIFERLADNRIYADRAIKPTFTISGIFGISIEDKIMRQKAKKYLRHEIGGYSQYTLGKAISYAEKGFDGIIHIYPFNCLPETVIKSILPKVSEDYDIPVICFSIDEQTGEAGFVTRLEAFIDLIRVRKKKKIGRC